jgi:hypothetical protein
MYACSGGLFPGKHQSYSQVVTLAYIARHVYTVMVIAF